MHDAIPVRSVFARILRTAAPPCEICGNDTDDPMHVLFLCPKAEQSWLASTLGLRIHALPTQVRLVIEMLSRHLTEADFLRFANHLWAFWKARCKEVYEGAKLNVRQVNSAALSYTFVANLMDRVGSTMPCPERQQQQMAHGLPIIGNVCRMDGSYHPQGQAGWAFTLYKDEHILEYRLGTGTATSPLHAESIALLHAVNTALARGWETATFLSDCQTLVAVVTGTLSADTVDWKAYTTLLEIIALFGQHHGFSCYYIPRSYLRDEHLLANRARIYSLNCVGHTFPSFPPL
ncbi:hypothetical protein LUZ62_040745 [Rhynchospora pubera]|uniref:RNase H type-1 domain-containing protein n=1 Tax=Rhynchospora pubera TaxID=906938 RepID=A0AAV8F8N3_9POAL|nr:hypothetical protein LUZ62_040745 [Rhynchospora pubera]